MRGYYCIRSGGQEKTGSICTYNYTILNEKINIVAQDLKDIPTPRKTRFIGDNKIQRLFEITQLRNDQWQTHNPDEFCQTIQKLATNKTSTIVADFGHGMFEGQTLAALSKLDGFIGLNVQTNSSNFAYNVFKKHDHFSYLSIDTKEARLAYHDRFSVPVDLARRIGREYGSRGVSFAMTLGALGSFYFPKSSGNSKTPAEYLVPAFDDNVIDPVGAGDAFFGLTSLLVKVGCPDVIVPFIGNIFAGLKTKIVGNKSAVSKAQLTKAVSAILK